nr:MAG TPA: hypothetical protein [Caudoviricetes sp.]
MLVGCERLPAYLTFLLSFSGQNLTFNDLNGIMFLSG